MDPDIAAVKIQKVDNQGLHLSTFVTGKEERSKGVF